MLSKIYYQEKYNDLINGSCSAVIRDTENKKLFSILVKLGKNICVRCKKSILDYKDCTIEHIIPHGKFSGSEQEKFFFDLNNIGFSHTRHNSSANVMRDKKEGQLPNVEKQDRIFRGFVCYQSNRICLITSQDQTTVGEEVDLVHLKYFNENHNLCFSDKIDYYLNKIDNGYKNEYFEESKLLIDQRSEYKIARGSGISKYKGVNRRKQKSGEMVWRMSYILPETNENNQKKSKVISKTCETELEAAEEWDIHNLTYFPDRKYLNFPNKLSYYYNIINISKPVLI